MAAAHLKPLAKNDKIQLEEKIVSPWNTAAMRNSAESTKPTLCTEPTVSEEFPS